MTTYEKLVKGATKVKIAAPKPKYIEPILMSTSIDHPVESENFQTVMKTLHLRLQDSSWSVVFKALIVLHIMIREGDRDVTLNYITLKAPKMFNLSTSNITKNHNFNSDIKFIIKYSKYLATRVKQFELTKIDYVRDERANNVSGNGGRLRLLTIEKGLLREAESVQKQIDSLLKNNFMENEINNDVILTAFRLLVNDLLALFQELNEGVINILEHYFEMSKVDAESSLKIYKKFVDQTKYVIDYLRVAKHLEYATKLHVPTIKHAPTALTSSLEEYLLDPNFEFNRREYIKEKSGKGGDVKRELIPPKEENTSAQEQGATDLQRNHSLIVQQSTFNPWGANLQQPQVTNPYNQQFLQQQPSQQVLYQARTGTFSPLPSIAQGQEMEMLQQQQMQLQQQQQQQLEQQQIQQQQQMQQQQHMQQQQQMQQQQMQQQQMQQLQQQSLQNSFTGAGFGGYGPQQPLQPQSTNPFMQQQQQQPTLNRTDTNPFSKMTGQAQPGQTSANPFANTRFASSTTTALSANNGSPAPILASVTGSNPFKVSETTTSLFNNVASQPHQVQALKSQPTAGGLENLPTIAVFPSTQQEAQKQYFLNNAQTGLQQQATAFQQQPFQQQQTYQNTSMPFQQQQTQQFQPQFTQQLQYQQQQPQGFVNQYDGPSLI